jgi:hypothetical protein
MSIPPNAHVILGIVFLVFSVLLVVANRRKER